MTEESQPPDDHRAHAAVGVLHPDADVETIAAECYDNIRPGAYIAVIAPTGHHRITSTFEDTGFTIRDTIVYLRPQPCPIVVARRPLEESTVAENCLEYGTGALNVGECEVETEGTRPARNISSMGDADSTTYGEDIQETSGMAEGKTSDGRFPANVILDEEGAERLDQQTGELSAGHWTGEDTDGYGESRDYDGAGEYGTSGGASRYFNTFGEGGDGLFEHLVTLLTNDDQDVYDLSPVPVDGLQTAVENVGRTMVN